MPAEPTLLRTLITKRHWQRFETFETQFKRAARELANEQGEPSIAKATVSPRQFERWYSGKIKRPHPDSCRVLEHMFGFPVDQLLAARSQAESRVELPDTLRRADIVAPIANFQYSGQSVTSPTAIWNCGHEPERAGEPGHYWRMADDNADTEVSEPERIIAMAARRAMQFGAAADASNVGRESVDQLRSEAGRLAVAYLQQPITHIIGDIVSLQDHSSAYLKAVSGHGRRGTSTLSAAWRRECSRKPLTISVTPTWR